MRTQTCDQALIAAHAASANHMHYYKYVELSTAGICFLGTPHQGSDGVSWLQILSNFQSLYAPIQRRVVDDLKPFSAYLEHQLERYRAIGYNYSTVYCYEQSKTSVGGTRTMVHYYYTPQLWS
jgi:hypothetical protein